MDVAILLNEIRRSAGTTPVGGLTLFPPGQGNLINVGVQTYLKTGVVALQSVYPSVPFASVGAWGTSTVANRSYTAGSSVAGAICFGAGVFVTTSSNFNVQSYFYWSTDGKNWSQGTRLSQFDGTTWGDLISSIIWDGAQFVAMGPGSVWTSADGKTWTFKSNLSTRPTNWGVSGVQLLFGNGVYIALGGNGNNCNILYSTNLTVWTDAGSALFGAISNGGSAGIYSVLGTFDGTKFVYVAIYYPGSGGKTTVNVFSSTNGYSGMVAGTLLYNGLPVVIAGSVKDLVTYNGNVYFQNGVYTLVSTDHGLTFNATVNNSGQSNLYQANGYFYCGGGTDGLQISADAKNWRNLVSLNYPSCNVTSIFGNFYGLTNNLAYGNSILVANTNDLNKTLVFSNFGQFVDNFTASSSGGNPYYLRVQ